MGNRRNIFGGDAGGIGWTFMPPDRIAAIVMGGISLIASVFVVAFFDEITARIAVLMADLLTSGALVLITIIGVVIVLTAIRRKIRRAIFGW